MTDPTPKEKRFALYQSMTDKGFFKGDFEKADQLLMSSPEKLKGFYEFAKGAGFLEDMDEGAFYAEYFSKKKEAPLAESAPPPNASDASASTFSESLSEMPNKGYSWAAPGEEPSGAIEGDPTPEPIEPLTTEGAPTESLIDQALPEEKESRFGWVKKTLPK